VLGVLGLILGVSCQILVVRAYVGSYGSDVGFCNVCVCVCVCVCGFCSVWVRVGGFVMFGCVYVWVVQCVGLCMCGFCNV
jgi:hypothetical protein